MNSQQLFVNEHMELSRSPKHIPDSAASPTRSLMSIRLWLLCAIVLLLGSLWSGRELIALGKLNQGATADLAGSFLRTWGTTALLLILAGSCWDMSRRPLPWKALRDTRADILIAALIFITAVAVRSLGPITGAVDEILVLGENIGLHLRPTIAITAMSEVSYPYFTHWAIFFLNKATYGFVDTFILMKVVSVVAASLSIAVWYWVVRLYCPRHVAIASSSLLTFWGWHYVNSRFVYLYSHDFLVISLGVLSCLLAFRDRLVSAAALLGIVLAYSLIVLKVSIMLFPFVGYVFLDCLLTTKGRVRWRLLAVTSMVLLALLLTFSPWFLVNPLGFNPATWNSGSTFFRYNQALQSRNEALVAATGGQVGSVFYLFFDAFRQLWFDSYDAFRHYFKPRGALLDPAFSIFFAIGLGYACINFRSKQLCRFALVGLLLFMLPMVVSFPLESVEPRGMARRMLGITCFVSLIAALGTERLAIFLFPARIRVLAILSLVLISAGLNARIFVTSYLGQTPGEWLAEQGLERSAPLLTVRNIAMSGERVVVIENLAIFYDYSVEDLPKVKVVRSGESIKDYILSYPNEPIHIVLPASTPARPYPTKEIQEYLASLVAPDAWKPGLRNLQGEPLVYIARRNG